MGEPAQHSIAQRSTAGCIARTRDSQLAALPALLSSLVDEGPLAGGVGGEVAGRGGVHVLRNPRLLLLPPCSQRPQHAQQGGFCSDFAAIQVALLPPVHKTASSCKPLLCYRTPGHCSGPTWLLHVGRLAAVGTVNAVPACTSRSKS